MATGTAKVTNPSSGTADTIRLAEVVSPQGWADLMSSANAGAGVALGTRSVKALHVDGIGNQVATAPGGTIRCAGSAGQIAVTATGGANASGANFTGGAGDAYGVVGFGTGTQAGVAGDGGATGCGVEGNGGATSGAGGVFTATAGNSDGVRGAGVGTGAGVRATAGPVAIDTGIASNTAGAAQTVALGSIYKDTAPFAWGYYSHGGGVVTFRYGANIESVTRAANGKVSIVLNTAAGGANRLCVVPASQGAARFVYVDNFTVTNDGFDITTRKADNTADEDGDVSFVVFAA